jgi:hypothetical protein
VFFEIPLVNAENATTLYYNGNVDNGQNLSLTAIVPVRVTKSWETNNTLVVSYNEYSAAINNEQLENNQWFYMLQTSQNILLPRDFKFELNDSYLGDCVYCLYRVEPRWWIYLGLKKSFMEEKLDLTLNANDIFRSNRPLVTARVGGGNVSKFDQYLLNRSVGVTLRYNFSKGQKIKERQHSESLEEIRRTGN